MDLIEKKGGESKPEKIVVELDREDGEILAEALDHAGHALQRLNDAQIERGEDAPEGVHQPPDDYGDRAAAIAGWFGLRYTKDVHFLDDAIHGEEERRDARTARIVEAAEEFRQALEPESPEPKS